ncbi:MAG: hypothetical protein CL843_09490 [Crocinitomicaceae bacterium]|nr:hypothetical protein [Crocinitomicaceae bacterium]
MFSGNNIGAWALPQKGDMVWIEFEAGNVNHAIWSYGWHTKTSTPQESLKTNYHIKTSGGHSILVNDVDGIIQIKIEGGKTFTIDEKTIVHGNGNEPAVLGNKNEDALNLLSTQVSQIYTSIMTFCAAQSAASSSGVLNPLNAGYTSLNTSLTTYSNAFTTEKDTTISATKSEIVKLD